MVNQSEIAEPRLSYLSAWCVLFENFTCDFFPPHCPLTSDEMGFSSASWLEHRTGMPLTQVRFPGAARDFLPRVNFQCRLSSGCPYIPVCNRMH